MFFFFQAEDGIRDIGVTGVQTCALFFSSRRRHTRYWRDWSSECALPISREPGIYGEESLSSVDEKLNRIAKREGASLETFQSNHEGALIERIHAARKQGISWIIVNPGRSEERRVGKSVDLGGRRIIKKKK